MQQEVLSVIAFLIRAYLVDDYHLPDNTDQLLQQLAHAGFSHDTICKAFSWFDTLLIQHASFTKEPAADSIHIYTTEEYTKINAACRNLILYLERATVLNTKNREILINQLTHIYQERVDLNDVKWVTLAILFSQHADLATLKKFDQACHDYSKQKNEQIKQ